MISFAKPRFSFDFSVEEEINNLKELKSRRRIPEKSEDHLLLCSWNIANLGLHHRGNDHYQLIAEILSWFDVIAIQEVHDNLQGLYELENFIGTEYGLMFNDQGGNDERAAFFYDSTKVERLQMAGELAIPPSKQRRIKLPGVNQNFKGFDRNPYIGSFQFRNAQFILINAHLFFGGNKPSQKNRRALEAFAIGRYADLRRNDKHVFTKNIIALGDFNIPLAKKGDPIFDALTARGLCVEKFPTKMGTTLANRAQYDQVAFFPGLKRKIKASGAFDYDKDIFPRLWKSSKGDFRNYCKYYISDHRPVWSQIKFD